jgi:CHRD domain
MRRRRVAWASVTIVVAAVVVAWAIILPGGDKRASSTSTSVAPVPSSTSTSTTRSAATTTSTPAAKAKATLTYSAHLTGENEIPALSTSASGTFTLTVAPDGSSVRYVLSVSAMTNVTVARLHEGKAGATGATLLTVYGGPTKSGVFSGTLTQGSFAAVKLAGSLKGKTIADFVALVKAGAVYLNVGTSAHPRGEIRGQLK